MPEHKLLKDRGQKSVQFFLFFRKKIIQLSESLCNFLFYLRFKNFYQLRIEIDQFT